MRRKLFLIPRWHTICPGKQAFSLLSSGLAWLGFDLALNKVNTGQGTSKPTFTLSFALHPHKLQRLVKASPSQWVSRFPHLCSLSSSHRQGICAAETRSPHGVWHLVKAQNRAAYPQEKKGYHRAQGASRREMQEPRWEDRERWLVWAEAWSWCCREREERASIVTSYSSDGPARLTWTEGVRLEPQQLKGAEAGKRSTPRNLGSIPVN